MKTRTRNKKPHHPSSKISSRRTKKQLPKNAPATHRPKLTKVAARKKIVEPIAPPSGDHRPPYFPSLTNDVVLGYQRHRVGAALPWDHERHPVRTSWAKLSNDIGPRESGRGIRSGM